MGGKSGTVSVRSPRLDVFRIQTSSYGRPIGLVWGQTRVPGNLLWYGNFRAIPHTTVEESGGKGGGGGVTTETTTFTYQAALVCALCEGPIDGVGVIWRGKEMFTLAQLGFSLFNGTPQQAPWGYLLTNFPAQAIGYEDTAIVAHPNYQLTDNAELHNHNFEIKGLNRFGILAATAKTFTLTLNTKAVTATPINGRFNATSHGFTNGMSVRLTTTGTLPGNAAGGGITGIIARLLWPGFQAGVTYYVVNATANDFQLALTPGGVAAPFSNAGTGTHTCTETGAAVASTAHGFTDGQIVKLTTSGTLPSPLTANGEYYVVQASANAYGLSEFYNGAPIELTTPGTGTHTATRFVADANPKDVVNGVLTNPTYGALFPAGKIFDLTQYSNYCVANDLFVSPALTEQRSAAEFLKTIFDITNSEPVWSDGKLKIVPYGDIPATGNGVTFTPNVTPEYDLTDDDFCPAKGEPPVRHLRKPPADAFNQVQVEFVNRRMQYNIETAEAKDQANIDLYGLRPQRPEKLDAIVEPNTAGFVVQARLQRALYIRNGWRWRLSMRYSRLEPMDIVTLTEIRHGLSLWPVRITAVTETEDGYLEFEGEDFPLGLATPALFQRETGLGYNADYNAAAGDINAPEAFPGPGILTVSGFELWFAISGQSAEWGGCDIWVSTDGDTYKQHGTIFGGARHGVLRDSFASGSDPDTVNTLEVDLAISRGELLPGTQADADAFNTLCLVGDELIAYSGATLVAANQYDLGTYLRRGVHNSTIAASTAAGERFVRLDQAIFRYAFDSAFLGSTIFFKFVAFNKYGRARQNIADVVAYSYVLERAMGHPSNVASLGVSQNGNVVVFQWPLIEGEPNINGYEIRFTTQGAVDPTVDSVWEGAGEVTRVTRGTQITTAKVPPGDWTFLIRARDQSENYSRLSATRNATVTSDFDEISSIAQAPTWPGTLTNFLVHHTGVLVPESTLDADQLTNVELFEQFVPYPEAVCSYESPEVDIGKDGDVRIWASVPGRFRADVTGQFLPAVEVDYRASVGAYDGFQPWTIGQVTVRFVKYKFTVHTSDGRPVVRDFVNVIDTVERQENVDGITIGAGGQAITFQTPFFNVPTVYFDNDSATVLIATSTGVSETGFTGHLYNTSGTQVGGTGKYRAIGV